MSRRQKTPKGRSDSPGQTTGMAADILAPSSRALLERFAACGTLYAFDFDGTLASIVRRRGDARMRASTLFWMRRLAGLAPCALITGRALKDIRPRVRGVRWAAIVGNHGFEAVPPLAPLGNAARIVARWERALSADLAAIPGVEMESKRYSLSVHYRKARNVSAARKRVLAAATKLSGARLIDGKRVLNVTVEGMPDKGDCVRLLRERLGCARVVYVGDDVTDQDVFDLGTKWLLDVQVGKMPGVKARYVLREQRRIEDFLSRLVRGISSRIRPVKVVGG